MHNKQAELKFCKGENKYISASSWCDGKTDCEDNEDEENCPTGKGRSFYLLCNLYK